MGILYREICNGCGTWNNENTATFNRIEIDLSNYVLFSCGFRLKEPKIEIFVCNKCYSEMKDLSFQYTTGDEVERLRRILEKKDKELEEQKSSIREYKCNVQRLLEPIEKLKEMEGVNG